MKRLALQMVRDGGNGRIGRQRRAGMIEIGIDGAARCFGAQLLDVRKFRHDSTLQLDDRLDLDHGAAWQRCDANGGARMTPRIAEYGGDEVGVQFGEVEA